LRLAAPPPEPRQPPPPAVRHPARQQQPVGCEYRLNPLRVADCGLQIEETADETKGAAPENPQSAGRNPQPDRWVRDTLAPQFDSAGRLLGWVGGAVDVSGQRALAGDLRP